jgi:hypothetical protein
MPLSLSTGNLKTKEPPESMQLKRAKRQLKGQLTIGWENKENLMLAIGKSYLLLTGLTAWKRFTIRLKA